MNHTEPIDTVAWGPAHGWVQKTHLDLLTEQALSNNILNINDLSENTVFQKDWEGRSNEAFLVTNKGSDDQVTPGHIEFLQFENDGKLNYYGTRLSNKLIPNDKSIESNFYGATGNDIFLSLPP